MAVGIMGDNSRDGWLVTMNLSMSTCPVVSVAEQMHGSTSILVHSVEKKPDGEIDNLHII